MKAYLSQENLEALGQLFERYSTMIFGVCLKYLANPADSEDAAMEIFEILMRKLPAQEIGNFRSWLYVVVKNHCLQILRKRSPVLTEDLHSDSMHSAHEPHPESEELNWKENGLHDCLGLLPVHQKKTIELFYFKSKSYQEIADEMVIDKELVRSYIQNGRRNLKKCMESKATEIRSENDH